MDIPFTFNHQTERAMTIDRNMIAPTRNPHPSENSKRCIALLWSKVRDTANPIRTTTNNPAAMPGSKSHKTTPLKVDNAASRKLAGCRRTH